MPAQSGAAGGEVLFSGNVQLTLTAADGVAIYAPSQDPLLDNTQVQIRRTSTRLTTQNVSSTRKKQHTVDFEYTATFTGHMVGEGFSRLAVTIDGYLAQGHRPPRLKATINVPPASVSSSLTVPGFSRTLLNGDLDTFDLTIPTAGALTNSVSIIFDTLQ
jgi:hypothetical protein